jgi:hypothetical protein
MCRYGFYPPVCGTPGEPATMCAIGISGQECNGTGTCDRLAGRCKCEPGSAGPSCSSDHEMQAVDSSAAPNLPAIDALDISGGISFGEWISFRNGAGGRLRSDSSRRLTIDAPDDASSSSTFELVNPTGKAGWVQYSAPLLLRSANGRFVGIEAGDSDNPVVIKLTGRDVGRHTVFSLHGGRGVVKAGDWVAVSSPAGYLLCTGRGPQRFADVSFSSERTELDNLQIVAASSNLSPPTQGQLSATPQPAPRLSASPSVSSVSGPRADNARVVHYGQYVSLTDRAGRQLLMGTNGHVSPLHR